MRAAVAWCSCRLSEEVVPVEVKSGRRTITVEKDEHLRPDTTLEGLAALPPSFGKDGMVTAGNASGIVDGAAAVVVTSEENAKAKGKRPLGRLISWAVVGCEPELMGIGPAPAARAALARAGLTQDQIDLWEINEAFAGQILGVVADLGLDRGKLNVNGGAIALGHPLGATGTRCTLTLLKEMRRRAVRYGLAGACIGGGQGIAVVLENPEAGGGR
jgi:acetyl-CoA acetyltransferase family protein